MPSQVSHNLRLVNTQTNNTPEITIVPKQKIQDNLVVRINHPSNAEMPLGKRPAILTLGMDLTLPEQRRLRTHQQKKRSEVLVASPKQVAQVSTKKLTQESIDKALQ